jgi:hypothetical protein
MPLSCVHVFCECLGSLRGFRPCTNVILEGLVIGQILAYEQFAILDLVQPLADICCAGGLEYDFEVRRLH